MHHRFILRLAYLVALTAFLCSFQVNAQHFDVSPPIAAHESNTAIIPLTFLIAEGYVETPKITDKVVSLCFMGLLLIVLLLTYRVKRKGSSLIIKSISHLFQQQGNNKNIPLEVSQTTDLYSNLVKTTHSISTETYNSILKKINKFEKSEKFLRKDINLTWLSNHLNTNTKYLSEVIKSHTGKNFNGYINGLRIRYIINKLTEMPVYRDYKISYLAEECGYGSPQVFAIAFKRETGVTPSYFIEQFKNGPDDTLNQSSA
ncbi:MAG: helix-turn-helix domain-containing protein [Candidatus Chryseobacterium colombiense]|nr:helix-turn-helix domain-containing protein [Chryseobacterium sp.]WEK70471.1 MAG: helix-turn-helix domain-containing protein [Chryseobacterium sp.]